MASRKSANYIGDSHCSRFIPRVVQNDHIERPPFAHGKYLPEIVGLRYTVSGSLEVEAPRREQRAIDAHIRDVCHSVSTNETPSDGARP